METNMKKIMCFLRSGFLIALTTPTFAWAAATPEPTDSPALKAGDLVFISGQGAGSVTDPDPDGAALAEAFEKIRVIAKQMGSDLNNVVKLTVYMADLPHDYASLNTVVPHYFKKPYPTRSTVGVLNLPKEHRVEIDAILMLKQ
jgi:2-iminobutanoate/2-iminopropanoate deaminase